MSNETQPQPSPAALLAGVLNLIRFEIPDIDGEPDDETDWRDYTPRRGKGKPVVRLCHEGEGYSLEMDPTSLSDLARVVAMLDGEQRRIYNRELAARISPSNSVAPAVSCVLPSETMLASTADHLAALVAAVGLGENGAAQ